MIEKEIVDCWQVLEVQNKFKSYTKKDTVIVIGDVTAGIEKKKGAIITDDISPRNSKGRREKIY